LRADTCPLNVLCAVAPPQALIAEVRGQPTVAWHWKRLDACPPLGIPAPLPRSSPSCRPDGPPDHIR